jgi:hypothetical protein
MNINQPLNLTSSAAVPDGAMTKPWMLQSGPWSKDYVNVQVMSAMGVLAGRLLTGAEAQELRDALTAHLSNIGHMDAPFGPEQLEQWRDEAILDVADNLTLATINGVVQYVDRSNGERFTDAAADSIRERAGMIRALTDPAAEDLGAVIATQSAANKVVDVVNLSGQAGITAEAAARLVLTPAGNGPGHGSWDQWGTFYTAAAVRSLKVKAERHARWASQGLDRSVESGS